MSFVRRTAVSVLLVPLAVWSCTDADLVGPDASQSLGESTSSSAAVVIEEAPGFYFLPPLAEKNQKIDEEFNPNFRPELRVCELPMSGSGQSAVPDFSGDCVSGSSTVLFGPGEAEVSVASEQYVWSWDTDAGASPRFDTNAYYRLDVVVGDIAIGSINLDPQKPNGPGASDYPDETYAFRVGETIPVKTFIAVSLLCDTSRPEVLECITNQVVGTEGGTFFLDGEELPNSPPVLSVEIKRGAADEEFLLTLERLREDLVGEGRCIAGLDVPSIFGPEACFRVNKTLEADLEVTENGVTRPGAVVSICLDENNLEFADGPLAGEALTQGQKLAIEMARRGEDGTYEVLERAAANCAVPSSADAFALESTLMSLGLDDDDQLDDGPSDEVGIRLGALSSSFSNFEFVLRGSVLDLNEIDGSTIQPEVPEDFVVEVPVQVVNRVEIGGELQDVPVPGATLEFRSNDGSLSGEDPDGRLSVMTDDNGRATVTWTITDEAAGPKELVVSSFGVVISDLPTPGLVVQSTETFTVNVLGDPARFGPVSPTDPLGEAEVLTPAPELLSVTVWDEAGQAIPGAEVEWTGDGTVEVCVVDGENDPTCETVEVDESGSFSTFAGADGTVTVRWSYGPVAGDQSLTASLPGTEADTTFSGTAKAGAPARIEVSPEDPISGFVGQDVSLSVTVWDGAGVDGAGNLVSGAGLTWSVDTGDGSLRDASTTTDASGVGTATWTLGFDESGLGASVSVDGTELVGTFTATSRCTIGFGSAEVNGIEADDEWACADSTSIEVNLGGGATAGTLKSMNDGEKAYFLLRVEQGTGAEINSLRFDFDSDGETGATADDDVLVYDAETTTFVDGYLTKKCENRSQTTCYGQDPVSLQGDGQDMEAAAANGAGFTTYEVSQALSSGQAQDIDASDGEPIAFFFTLFNGNGAKGNTQYPGFRVYDGPEALFFSKASPPSGN